MKNWQDCVAEGAEYEDLFKCDADHADNLNALRECNKLQLDEWQKRYKEANPDWKTQEREVDRDSGSADQLNLCFNTK